VANVCIFFFFHASTHGYHLPGDNIQNARVLCSSSSGEGNDLSTDRRYYDARLREMRVHKKYNVPLRYITMRYNTRKTDRHDPFRRRAFPEIIDPQHGPTTLVRLLLSPPSSFRLGPFTARSPSVHEILIDFPL